MLDINMISRQNAFDFSHHTDLLPSDVDFHLHDNFEIYLFVSGKVNYFVEKKIYTLKEGDLLVMNSKEIHKATFTELLPYERYVLHFSPSLIYPLNTEKFNLLKCFDERPLGENNRIQLNQARMSDLLQIFTKLEDVRTSKTSGYEALSLCYLVEILVLINTAFSNNNLYKNSNVSIPNKLTPILEYIDLNIDGDLSLQTLEAKFYINRYYLCRLFKSFTGSSIHEYILYKRISYAKGLLLEGASVTEVCMRSGFGDYSNFIRIFKKTTGITPGQFAKSRLYNYPSKT